MSAEERHRNRRTRLIEAATELIGTRGVAAATVTAVCAESGVTSRYFYQHFSDRDALLRAVYQQLYATFQEVIVDAIPDAGDAGQGAAQRWLAVWLEQRGSHGDAAVAAGVGRGTA